MWSLGVILYRMLFKGKYPFLIESKNYDVPMALKDVVKNKLIIPKHKRSSELVYLVQRMLIKE